VKRPTGIIIIAVLTFLAAAVLALGSIVFFVVAVMSLTGGDAADPASAAIAGMGVAGGFSLLVLAGVATGLAIGVLKLREWARIVSIGAIAVGIACAICSVFAFAGYPVIPVVPMVGVHLILLATGAWMLSYLVRPRVKLVFRVMAMQRLSLRHQAH
jgi:hypothetical protein